MDIFRFEDEDEDDRRVRDLTSSFFASSQNIDFPESFITPFFTGKVTLLLLKEVYALSLSQNNKTFINTWYLVYATSTFSLRLVVGTLRNHGDDGNGNVKTGNRFNEQNNDSARASRYFVHFFAFTAQLRR